jgi:WD40 repeat protein/serine/threonine protein kinase
LPKGVLLYGVATNQQMNSQKEPSERRCKDCDATLSRDATGELCLRCALGNALKPPDQSRAASSVSSEHAPAPGKPPEPQLRPFGDYELLEEIARGGMGVVYRARQVSLDRIVAVKMILFGPLASAEQVRRFRTEASAAGCLQHPSIVTIHEVGLHEKQHYLVMDYVDGPNLGRLVQEGPLSAKRAAGYVKVIAEAVHYAHERGILHRDLKPSNVLIDSDDRPRVVDFGLAKRFTGDSSLTISGQVLGSPSYMPPEQAGAGQVKVARYSDVYSLGAILYHLLTGRPPFQAETVPQTLNLVTNTEPVSPRLLNPGLPRDLETICLKCLEKEPKKRYRTAQALAEEVDRFLLDEPILARPVSRRERVWRWCTRKPALAGSLAALVVAMAAGMAGVTWQWRRAEQNAGNEAAQRQRADREREHAEQQRQRAEREELTARRYLYAADMNLALQAVQASHLGRAWELLERNRPSPGVVDLRGWEWRYLWRLCQSDELCTLGQHSNSVAALAFSPDGGSLVSGDDCGELRFWNALARREYRQLGLGAGVRVIAFSPDGTRLALAAGRSVRFWNPVTLQEQGERLQHQEPLEDMAFSPDADLLVTAWGDQISIWNTATRRQAKGFVPERPRFAEAIALSPDNQTLAVGLSSGKIKLWDLPNNSPGSDLSGHRYIRGASDAVSALVFSRDGRTLVSAGWDKTVKVWDVGRRQMVADLPAHGAWVSAIAFSPDGRLLASASADQTVKLWDTATWLERATLRGHRQPVMGVTFAPDSQSLASGARDGSVKLWPAQPKPAPSERLLLLPGGDFSSLSPDARWLFVEQSNHTFLLVETTSLTATPRRPIPMRGFSSAAVAPGGAMLAFGARDGAVRLYAVKPDALEEVAMVRGHTNGAVKATFSADGARLATIGGDNWVRIWNIPRLEEVASFKSPSSEVFRFAFSADGSAFGIGYYHNLAVVFDVAGRKEIARVRGHATGVPGLAFSSNGELLVTAGSDGTARLWNVKEQRQVQVLRSHFRGLYSIDWSPDGSRLAAGTSDGTVQVWDLATSQEVATFGGHTNYVSLVRFTPDGHTLVAASADAVSVRRAATWEEVAAAEKSAH